MYSTKCWGGNISLKFVTAEKKHAIVSMAFSQVCLNLGLIPPSDIS